MARQQQTDRWRLLADLLAKVERKGLAGVDVAEALAIGRLYRQVTIDLSRARASNAHPDELAYLNTLAARAHGQVYRAKRPNARPALTFLAIGFPRLVRKHWLPIFIAALAFFGTAAASFVAVVRQPHLAYSLFDEEMIEFENIRLEKQQGEYKGNFTFSAQKSPVVAAQIIVNNIMVSLRTFAFGALLGLPCLYMLVYNGRMLGTLQGLMWTHGYFRDFHALILTHGVLELSAITIAGGSGLMLGWALIAPQATTRRAALASAAREAGGLLLGSCAMLVIAGFIEAFITPHYSQEVRWTVAGVSAALMIAYFAIPGRTKRAQTPIATPSPAS